MIFIKKWVFLKQRITQDEYDKKATELRFEFNKRKVKICLKLLFELKKPYDAIYKANIHSGWLPLVDKFRTLLLNEVIITKPEFEYFYNNLGISLT